MALMQSGEPSETGPRLRAEAEIGNDLPPKRKLMVGKELHGTKECQ